MSEDSNDQARLRQRPCPEGIRALLCPNHRWRCDVLAVDRLKYQQKIHLYLDPLLNLCGILSGTMDLRYRVKYPQNLLQVQAQVDRMNPMSYAKAERDHGTWDGRWSLPASSQHELLKQLGAPLPCGVPDELHECSAALARREYKWTQWGQAAVKGWAAYLDNSAVQVLSLHKSQAVRKRRAQAAELDRIMVPRFVLTDKADGVRTAENPVPPQPSARLIVPGFQDRANLEGELRRGNPTCSRLSQHSLPALTAWNGRCGPCCRAM